MSYNITKILDERKLEYKDDGADYKILCLNPDHEDSDPSLRIDKLTGQFHCFSCGFKGHSILAFFNREQTRAGTKATLIKEKIRNITYELKGMELPDSREYWTEDFRGISGATLTKYRAFSHIEYGEGRICFPIVNASDKVVAVTARRLNSNVNPKYLNYPRDAKMPVFPAHRRCKDLVLVEGLLDMMALEDKGFNLPVSTIFGAKTFTYNNVVEKLRPFMYGGLRHIILLLDNDKAGRSAAEYLEKTINIKTDFKVSIANDYLPEGKDPGDLTELEVKQLSASILELTYN